MTKKRNLTTFMIAIMIMLFSLPANAEGTVGYAQWDELNTTLTFKGGGSVPDGAFELNTGYDNPRWNVGRESVTKVVFDESFKDVRPTSCYQWFRLFKLLTTIEGIENLNTEEVTNMGDMFNSCKGLKNLDLSSFNTAKVTDMSYMFSGSYGLTSLDLSSFNTAKVENMSCMFSYCSDLTTIYVSYGFDTDKVSSSDGMFYDCRSLKGYASYSEDKIDKSMANYTSGYFTKSNLTPCVKWNADTKVLTFKVAHYIEGTAGECKFNEGAIAPEGIKNNCKKVVFTPSFKQVEPTSCYSWFDSFSNLTTIQGIENLNTEKVTNMMFMFYGCKKLTSLDVSKFNTEKVTNMNGMFGSCSSLTSLDLSSFDTAKVEEMSLMFGNCTGLTSLDLSKFNTAKVWEMGNMFGGCSGLTSLNLSSFNTAKVTDMMNMFNGCKGLTSLDLSSFNTANVQVMSYMFNGCSGLTTINVSDAFTTNKVSNSDGMFGGCYKLEGATSYNSGKTGKDMANFDGYFTPKIITPYVKWDANTKVLTFKVANNKEEGNGVYDLNKDENQPEWVGEVYSDCEKVVFTPSFKQAKPTSCYRWFLGFSKPTTIEGIENLNTEKVTNMSEMFNSCSGLKSLDLSSFNTAKVKDMGYMFSGSYGLISLDLSSFNTAKVENMTNMFDNCYSLTTIYASDGFTTGEDISSDGMFGGCLELEGATSWDFGKTDKSMANFDGYFTPKIITPYVKWDASTNELTFKVANNKEEGVYDLNEGAKNPGWSIDDVKNNCTKVVFTPSFNHARPTSCYLWFEGFEQLTTIEGIENLNTEKVTNMSGMFSGCSNLTSLDVSKFNTAEVENMSYMFYICSSLTSLDVSKFNTAKVTDMGAMFGGCSGLTSLDLSSFNTAKVENMGHMFDICKDLTSLDLSSFNTAKVVVMYEMFKNCLGLTTIYVSDDFKIGNDTNGDNMFYNCTNLVGATSYSDLRKTGKEYANYTSGYFKTYFTLGDYKVELFGEQLTTESLDLSGDDDFVAHAPFTANEANYSRDLSSSGSTWFSLCLPFAYTPNNFTAYKLMSATDDAVEIEEMTGKIVAGTPVLFKFKDGVKKEINISAPGANIVKAPVVDGSTAVNGPNGSSLQLCGTYQTKTFSSADGNAFILLNDKLMNPAKMLDTGVTKVGVKPFRAYMTLTASAPAQLASARAFSIGRGDEGNEGTTAIDLLNSVATDDAEYYDINGRRIDAPVKGVNIVRRGNKTMKLIIK